MSDLDRIVRELVIANRILANEDVVDAYGHVSHRRHPDDPGLNERHTRALDDAAQLATDAGKER